nr:hypothetical protein [Tanacetum cinerariifolium]
MLPNISQIVNRLYAFIYETNHSKSGLGLPFIVALVMVIDKSWKSLGKHEKAFYTGLKQFVDDCKPYKTWIHHGEPDLPRPPPVIDNTRQPHMSDMATCLNELSYIPLNNEQNEPTQGDIGETSSDPTQAKCNEFEELYASANEELYPGCDYVTRLDFMVKFTYFKAKGKLTDYIFNEMLEFFQIVIPTAIGYKLPPSYYAINKTFKTIRLGYESIHACVNDCFLFRGDANKDVHFCPVCNTSRWKNSNTPGKKVPKKVLRYFLIIPRLQRLYKSSHTAKEMTWHATGKCTKPGKMQHPVDGKAWKDFDTNQSYSMWPVILTTYNLPSWLCMKKSSFMLTLLIHGLKSPDKDIDVYLRPLIDDLKDLWANPGVETIDVATGLMFNMRAMARQDLKRLGIRSGLWLGQNKNEKCSKPQATYSFTPEDRKKFYQFIKGVKLPDGFGSNFKHKVTDNDTNITGLKSHDCHIMMQRLLPYGLQQNLAPYVPKPLIELCLFFKKICSQTLMVDDMLKAQSMIHQHHVDNDPGDNESSELFAMACGPSQTLISVNSCVVNGVRFVVHSRDERCTTQNSGICSPGPDGEMYYDMARRPPGWKVVEHVNHKKFSNGGVIVVEDDPDVIHVDNSSDLALSTSLNDLEIAALHIGGQSIDVDAPPDIIDVVDEDDDIIDEEDPIPHDLADSDDEEFVKLYINNGVNMSADVARGHGGDGGGDDRKGTRKPNLGGKRAGRLHTLQETRNLGLKAITNKSGRVPIWFEVDDRETLMPLGDHAAHWANYLGDLVRELPLHYRSWRQMPPERKAGVVAKIETQFDLRPHMESDRWPQINAGIQQHLQKIYNGKKAALKERYWVPEEDGSYDLERIRRG